MKTMDHLKALMFAVIGFGFAYFTGILSLFLTGAGHGWGAGMWSFLGVFVLPVLGAAVAYRRTRLGRILLQAVAVGMVVIDLIILGASQMQGWSYLHKVVMTIPLDFAIWMFCWTAWQVAVTYALARRHRLEPA